MTVAGSEANRSMGDSRGSVERGDRNILNEAFEVGAFAFGVS